MPIPKTELNIYALSEYALALEYGQEINAHVFQQVLCLDALLHQKPFPGFRTTVPAYATLSIYYDPRQLSRSPLPGINCFDKAATYIRTLAPMETAVAPMPSRRIVIPVCYESPFGPDLRSVAAYHRLTEQEVTDQHSKGIYQVCMMGFMPGFAYLSGLPASLSTPRKQMPLQAVPAGSVGIAGGQTGIYPLESPGGWQIIGRTPVTLFNASRPEPALLKPGDRVSFKAITIRQYEQYRQDHAGKHY